MRETPHFHGPDYALAFGPPLRAEAMEFVETRLRDPRDGPDELDDLIDFAPGRVREWMTRKAKLADGIPIGLPICDAGSVLAALNRAKAEDLDWKVSPNGRGLDAWKLTEIALLRSLAMLSWRDVARASQLPLSTCQRHFNTHAQLLEASPTYAATVARVASSALRTGHS